MATTDKQRYLDEMASHKHTKALLETARAEIKGFGAELGDLRRMRDTQQFAQDASSIFQTAAEGTVGRLQMAATEAIARLEDLRLQTLDKMAALRDEEVDALRAENASLSRSLAEISGLHADACIQRDAALASLEPLNLKLVVAEKRTSDLVYRLTRHLGGPAACQGKTLNDYSRNGKQTQVNAFAIEAKVWLDEQLARGVTATESVSDILTGAIKAAGGDPTNVTVTGGTFVGAQPMSGLSVDPLEYPFSGDEAESLRRYTVDHPNDSRAVALLRVWDEAHPVVLTTGPFQPGEPGEIP